MFPCIPDGKQPACTGGFKAASTSIEQIDRWWSENPAYNIGMCPEAAGWAVVDVEHDGLDDWAKIENGRLPATYTVGTPRGGKHYYFAGSLPSKVRPFGGLAVDTRGVGGYVLVPPSIVGGKPYSVIADIDTIPLPDWIPAQFREHEIIQRQTQAKLSDVANRSRATTLLKGYVERNDVAIEGWGGDERTYRLFCELRDLGLSQGEATDLAGDIWNPHCQPPWDNLAEKAQNAYAYAQNAPGAYALTSSKETFAKAAEALIEHAPRFADCDPEEDAKGEDLEYWDDDEGEGRGLFPHYPKGGTLVAYGPTGSHKTNVILRAVLEAFRRGATVSYAQGEGAYEFGKVRIPLVCRDMGIGLKDLKGGRDGWGRFARVENVPQLLNPLEVDEFIKARQIAKPNIIVLDTLSRAISGLSENDQAVTSALSSALDKLRLAFNALIIIVHHSGKDSGKGARGGSGITSDPDAVLRISHDAEAQDVTVYVEKMRGGPAHFSRGYRVKNMPYTKKHKKTGGEVVLQVPVIEPIDDHTWRAKISAAKETPAKDDPLSGSKIGHVLTSLGATTPETAVSTNVLALSMTPHIEGETAEAHAQAVTTTERKLSALARGRLMAYTFRDGKHLKWFLVGG